MYWENRYFYFDSDMQLPVKEESTLLGYAIQGKSIIFYDGIKKFISQGGKFEPEEGKFLSIMSSFQEIVFQTDTSAQETLFYYSYDGFYAISNSLYLIGKLLGSKVKLRLYMPSIYSFTLNEGKHIGEQPITNQTIYEGVKFATSNQKIVVNGNGLHLVSLKKNDPFEGMSYKDAIVKFIERRIGIISGLVSCGYDIRSQLSGGMDSRLILSFLLNSGFSTHNNFSVQSIRSKEKDFYIAQRLSKKYGFEINKKINNPIRFSVDQAISAWERAYFGNYLPMRFPYNDFGVSSKVIKLSGEVITGWKFFSGDTKFKGSLVKIINDSYQHIGNGEIKRSLENDMNSFLKDADLDPLCPLSVPRFYKETRSRFHCGRQIYKDLYGSKNLSLLVGPQMESLDEISNKNGVSYKQLYFDIFMACAPSLASISFDSSAKNFDQSNFNDTPFNKPLQIKFEEYNVYDSDLNNDKNLSESSPELTFRQMNELFYWRFEELLKPKIEINKNDFDFYKLAAKELNRECQAHDMTHNYRMSTLSYFVSTSIDGFKINDLAF